MTMERYAKFDEIQIRENEEITVDFTELLKIWKYFSKEDLRRTVKNHPCWSYQWITTSSSIEQMLKFHEDHINCLMTLCNPSARSTECMRGESKYREPKHTFFFADNR